MHSRALVLICLVSLLWCGLGIADTNTKDDPNRCIDSVNVYVDDDAELFFSPFIITKLQSQLEHIDSVSELDLTEEQLERKQRFNSNRRTDWSSVEAEDTEGVIEEVRIRTVWKGGFKDLNFINKPDVNIEEDGGDLILRFEITNQFSPKVNLFGGTCNYQSRPDTTVISIYPEKAEGSKQNYKNLGSFLAHQLIKVSRVEGCNLGSEAKPLVVHLMANSQKLPLPQGVQLMTYEASASESERHERITLPEQYPERSSEGIVEIDVFNRPTDLVYLLEHPFESMKWREVGIWKIDDEQICDLFDNTKTSTASELLSLDTLEEDLDKAKLTLSLDSGDTFFQKNPAMTFKAKWFADAEGRVLVSESDTVRVSDVNTVDSTINLELIGYPELIFPGTYTVELTWQQNERNPNTKSISFPWRSTSSHNVSEIRGLLGPKFTKMRRNRKQSAARIMRHYYFQQPISGKLIRWENWPEGGAYRFAKAILWHFRQFKELPYLSLWSGEEGVASELVRALSVIVERDDEILEEEPQAALSYLAKLTRLPASFNKRSLRKAMCAVSNGLAEKGEAIPAVWMRCDG